MFQFNGISFKSSTSSSEKQNAITGYILEFSIKSNFKKLYYLLVLLKNVRYFPLGSISQIIMSPCFQLNDFVFPLSSILECDQTAKKFNIIFFKNLQEFEAEIYNPCPTL